jgi:hypothetical protein
VNHRLDVRVVEVEGVRQCAVRQGGVRRRGAEVVPDDARLPGAGPRPYRVDDRMGHPDRGGRQRHAQRVERVPFRRVDGRCRERVES